MNVHADPHAFEEELIRLSEVCYAVAQTLTKDPELARCLAEETILRAWAERGSLDLSNGLKPVLLSRLRAHFIARYRDLAAAKRIPNLVSYPAFSPRRREYVREEAKTRAVRH